MVAYLYEKALGKKRGNCPGSWWDFNSTPFTNPCLSIMAGLVPHINSLFTIFVAPRILMFCNLLQVAALLLKETSGRLQSGCMLGSTRSKVSIPVTYHAAYLLLDVCTPCLGSKCWRL